VTVRWLRRRTSKPERTQGDDDVRAVEEELAYLERDLAAARRRTSEILGIARTLRTLGEQNHFAPLIRQAFGSSKR
jgi:hypothetical protein